MDFGPHETHACLVHHPLDIDSVDAVPLHDELNDRIGQHILKFGFDAQIFFKLGRLCRFFRERTAGGQGEISFLMGLGVKELGLAFGFRFGSDERDTLRRDKSLIQEEDMKKSSPN